MRSQIFVVVLMFLLASSIWAQPDGRTDSIIVTQPLENRGFTLQADRSDDISPGDTQQLFFRTMLWSAEKLGEQEYDELEAGIYYGYFDDVSKALDAFERVCIILDLPGPTQQADELDGIRSRGLKVAFVKDHFVVAYMIGGLPKDITAADPFKLLAVADEIKAALIEKIDTANQPKFPPFSVDFTKTDSAPRASVNAKRTGGIEPFYRWELLRKGPLGTNEIIRSQEAVFFSDNEQEIFVSADTADLPVGSYLFHVAVGDRLQRGDRYFEDFAIGDNTNSDKTLSILKDSTLKSTKPHQNQGANPTLSLNHQEAPIAAFDLANTDLTGLTKATLVMNLEGCEFPGNGHSRRRGWNNSQAIEAYPLTQAWAEGNGYESDRRGRKGKFGSHHGSRRHGHSGNNGSGPGVTWFSPLDEEIRNNRPDGSSKWFGARTALGPRSAPSVPVRNGQTGAIEFDVTQDVLNGYYEGWLLKQKAHFQTGNFSFTSKEGGNSELAPKLLLEFSGPMAKASDSQEGTSLLGDLGFGSTGFKLRALRRRSELNNLREFLKENPTAAFVGDQVLRTVTRSNPSLCLASTVLYRTWLS